ncbi:MAG: hypothetical protein JO087_07385, partial [Actinobacteria bacterium]|nr:hypothetical protein [Actinomycetota bacterium]
MSNLDNCTVGVAYGIRDRRIAAIPNLIIALLTMAATAGAMTFGRELSMLVAPAVASALGTAIIIGIGVG